MQATTEKKLKKELADMVRVSYNSGKEVTEITAMRRIISLHIKKERRGRA